MDEIFVSYRRRDSSLFVDVLADRLRQVSSVFVDVDEIKLGDPFMAKIQNAICDARLVIVVIGLQWDPSRLHEEKDVVAYELRTAYRFARRVIPIVLLPGALPTLELLPIDLAWIAQLNAFMMPEPPDHRAHLAQLADLVKSALNAAHEEPPPVFSVPSDSRMLEEGRGNVAFKETLVNKEMRLCSIGRSSRQIWIASETEVEIRDLATGSVCNGARLDAEWLQATSWGALTATSAIGYKAPDTIHFRQLNVINNDIVAADAGFTWSWQFPPMAMSADEDSFLAYVETPRRKDVILFSVKDQREIGACAFPGSSVLSMSFDPAGDRYFVARSEHDQLLLSAVDAKTCSIQWSREIEAKSTKRNACSQVTFWHAPAAVLFNTGSSLLEVDPSSGEIRRTLMDSDRELTCLATDPSTSLACIAEGTSLRIWLPDWESFLTVDLSGDQCRACSIQNGFLAALVGTDSRCRLLTASTPIAQMVS